jgi:mannose-6-phosphate isomerase
VVQENDVTVERAFVEIVSKPWGSRNLYPWSKICTNDATIGEIWYEREKPTQPEPELLLKLLFTNEALSIQVHPDDAFAQSIGLPHGKTEAWYILAAAPDAQVALGLKQPMTASQLHSAIEDGSFPDFVHWRSVAKDDIVYVPAGAIHSIGPGLVIAEIQQRSDATFRLFDHDRKRELHIEDAVAAARLGPEVQQTVPQRLDDARTVLVTSPYFILERFCLAAKTHWDICAEQETWLFVIEGQAQIEMLNVFVGETLFLQAESTRLRVGASGMKCLLAYRGNTPNPALLKRHAWLHLNAGYS